MTHRNLWLGATAIALTISACTGQTERDGIAQLHKHAEAGDAQAQFDLGKMYENGEDVAEDQEKAMHWYGKSAKQGNADAQYKLGKIYRQGKGRVPKNYAESKYWYSKAVESYRKAAAQGDANAQYELGVMYLNGWGGAQDGEQATHWWRKAAAQGQADAQYWLGASYYYGDGAAQNYSLAYFWYSVAMTQGVKAKEIYFDYGHVATKHIRLQEIQRLDTLIAQCVEQDYKNCREP